MMMICRSRIHHSLLYVKFYTFLQFVYILYINTITVLVTFILATEKYYENSRKIIKTSFATLLPIFTETFLESTKKMYVKVTKNARKT